jgi:hypothetical protein
VKKFVQWDVVDNCRDREKYVPVPALPAPLPSTIFRRWPSMPDAATLTFALTYTGTLAVAALMLFGQLAAFTILLALAGIVRLLILPVQALIRRMEK